MAGGSCASDTNRTGRPSAFALALIVASLTCAAPLARGADWPRFRGPNGDGKSAQTGLLKEWPAEGPTLLWSVEDLGFGYSSVSVVGDTLYTTGLVGDQGNVYAYGVDGRLKWQAGYGKDWTGDHPGSRTTPTVDGGLLYVMSGHGRVACFDVATEGEKWAVDTAQQFGAQQISWGITESLLIDGDNLLCTPGGKQAGIVALNKKTGDTVWACSELTDKSGYCTPILIERGDRSVLCTLTGVSFVGVDADTGKLLWRHERKVPYDIHAVSPVYADSMIYITSGYGGVRGAMYELSSDGATVQQKWTDGTLDTQHGGVILHEGHIYGASHKNKHGNWICINLASGQVTGEFKGVGDGSVTFAEGMLYCYGQNSTVGLVAPSPTDFRLVSSFRITKGNREHWAHPVVANGRLYIRHGTALMAYDVGAK